MTPYGFPCLITDLKFVLQRPLSNTNGQVIIHQSGVGFSAESFLGEHQQLTSLSSAHQQIPATSFETDLTPLLNANPTTFAATEGQIPDGKFAIMLVSRVFQIKLKRQMITITDCFKFSSFEM
jgi:hypothetical protein